ncbi:hypothetical protein QG37_03850 [Candidozyma auris]|uniref:Uncharacterized protein n=1 Tax=Candidozyma auris TaxID=498019 RepID=A0A0L0NZ74_CANAR|nr:hypothetical protein QG37_03850 [[Candida] auris]
MTIMRAKLEMAGFIVSSWYDEDAVGEIFDT